MASVFPIPSQGQDTQKRHPAEWQFTALERWYPRRESNSRTWFRKPPLYPLSYGGVRSEPAELERRRLGTKQFFRLDDRLGNVLHLGALVAGALAQPLVRIAL